MDDTKTYSIREVAKLSGLPASTLRYYESIGIIHPIRRDENSKQRVYTEEDVDAIDPLACLNATGMPLEDMRSYVANMSNGKQGAANQITLLKDQAAQLETETKNIALRSRYVKLKISYWEAVEAGDTTEAGHIGKQARELAQTLKHLGK